MTSVSGSSSQSAGTAIDHLALAIEAANNLKTLDILLPVSVAREIMSLVSTPPPTPPPIRNHIVNMRTGKEIPLNN